MVDVVKIDGKDYGVKYPTLLSRYLHENARFQGDSKGVLVKEALSALVVIGIAIGGAVAATWYITYEQKDHILKEYVE